MTGRYQFGIRVDDPRQALDQLAHTIPLLDDICHASATDAWFIPDADARRTGTSPRSELLNLRRRLEAIHARLST